MIARIKVAVAHYGLTAEQLGLGSKLRSGKGRASAKTIVLYADGQGGTWGGRGKRPEWLRQAIAAGKTIEEFRVSGGNGSGSTRSTVKQPKPAKKAKRKAKDGYRDGAGNSWSGMGPKPKWLKAALAGGASLADMAIGDQP